MPEAAAVWPLLCIERPRSNWSVIDTGAPLFDPWRHPKRKANRAFPLSSRRAECLDSDGGAGSQRTWLDRSHTPQNARAAVQETMRKYGKEVQGLTDMAGHWHLKRQKKKKMVHQTLGLVDLMNIYIIWTIENVYRLI